MHSGLRIGRVVAWVCLQTASMHVTPPRCSWPTRCHAPQMKSIVSDAVYTLSNQMNQIELDRFNAAIAGISNTVSNRGLMLGQDGAPC